MINLAEEITEDTEDNVDTTASAEVESRDQAQADRILRKEADLAEQAKAREARVERKEAELGNTEDTQED